MAYPSLTVNLIGFIGSDPREMEVANDPTKKYAEFSLVTNLKTGNKSETPIWWNCYVFDEKVSSFILKYLKKGRMIAVTGEIRGINPYIDKTNTPKVNMRLKVYNVNTLDAPKPHKPEPNNNTNTTDEVDYTNKLGSKFE